MIDRDALGEQFYSVGVALADAVNVLVESINDVSEVLQRIDWTAVGRCSDAYLRGKSNNWLRMHGYPMRRRHGVKYHYRKRDW